MKLHLIKLGGVNRKEVRPLVDTYAERLSAHFSIESLEVKPKGIPKQLESLERSVDRIIALDERGTLLSTVELQRDIDQWVSQGTVRSLAFVVGDAHGLPREFLAKAHMRLSLSRLTLPSDFAWLLLWEQLYRVQTLRMSHPYHHA